MKNTKFEAAEARLLEDAERMNIPRSEAIEAIGVMADFAKEHQPNGDTKHYFLLLAIAAYHAGRAHK